MAKCLEELRTYRVHEQFVGYLCLLHTSAEEGKRDNLTVSFKGWHDLFLSPGDGTDRHPYISLFSGKSDLAGRAPDKSRFLIARNIAGSYSPSSIRQDSPLLTVASFAGEKRKVRFSLKENHATMAASALLYETRISAVALAFLLYRDYAFTTANVDTLLAIFREEFSLSGSVSKDADFEMLFHSEENFLAQTAPLFTEIESTTVMSV